MRCGKDDQEYIYKKSLQDGDISALNYFFSHYYTALVYFGISLLNRTADAEDLAHDTLVKLWEKRQTLSAEGSVRAWLFSTMRHACLDQLRHQVSVGRYRQYILRQQSEIDKVDERRQTAELHEQLNRMLCSLPPKIGRVLTTFYIEGKTYREIARKFRVSVHTVQNQRARGLQLLKQRYPHIGGIG